MSIEGVEKRPLQLFRHPEAIKPGRSLGDARFETDGECAEVDRRTRGTVELLSKELRDAMKTY